MGLYDPATNVLGFVTSGVERMRIASNGNVGIGTSNPNVVLDISGTTNPGVRLFSGNVNAVVDIGNTTNTLNIATVGTAGNFSTAAAIGDVVIRSSNGTNRMFLTTGPSNVWTNGILIASNGNVGIGTTAPRSSWITNTQTGGPAFDVSGQMYGRLPVIVWSVSSAIDYNTNFLAYQNSYVYITNSAFSAITLPSSTTTSNGGGFLQLKNATSSFLSITLTNTLTLTSPVSIAPSNAITFVVSPSNANTMLLF
jgi:hypothetical protein